MTVCSSDLKSHQISFVSSPTSDSHPHNVKEHSPIKVRKNSDANVELKSQSSSVETIAVLDHATRSSRSATPTICIEPDALDISVTAAILSFDDNQVVTTDTAAAKARNSGGSDQPVISYSDEDSNCDGLDNEDELSAGNEIVSQNTEGAGGDDEASASASAAENDSVSEWYEVVCLICVQLFTYFLLIW